MESSYKEFYRAVVFFVGEKVVEARTVADIYSGYIEYAHEENISARETADRVVRMWQDSMIVKVAE